MNRLAIFVEGQTEQLFVERLVAEIAGANRVHIEAWESVGKEGARRLRLIKGVSADSNKKFYVLLVNSGSDTSVKSDIRDQYEGLASKGYWRIIGVRDVFPLPMSGVAELRKGLSFKIKTKPIPVIFILGVMEIETWFITEHTHFEKIDASLTIERIQAELGFNPETDDIQLRNNPAADLHSAYQLAGKAYNKRKKNASRTVNAVDYTRMYLELDSRLPDLGELTKCVTEFLSL